ncbi:unnamed protein product [Durusdinium trenchii]|uniref:Uncharacterized protein n=1 Tax=Durusdinium trenchii TaxID=1381693 RepID=A0ABP0SN07_9DINO
MEERIVQSLGGEASEDQQREVVVERHARHPRRSAAPRAPSTSDVHEERRQQVLEDRIRQVRAQVEQQRLEETRVEHTLMTRVEDLERQLQHRRQSIVHRISREQEREENLRKYLRYLEDADLEDLRREIRLRKDSALLKEETLRQQLEHLLPSPPSPKGERGHREERLERQIALRRQLETLKTSEGSDSVRRHLLALKQAEMMEFQREVQLHRMEDEAKELPMRQQLEELHEEWQRFRVQCEHERQAAEMQEEQILLEMSSLTDHRKRQEQDMSPDTSKERRSKSRQALGARSSSEGGKASGRGLELERRDPVPSSHWGSQELDLTPQHNVVGPPIHLEDGPGRHSGPPGGASRGRSDQEDLSPQSARSGTDVTPVVSQSRSVVSGQESEDEADESDDDLLFI